MKCRKAAIWNDVIAHKVQQATCFNLHISHYMTHLKAIDFPMAKTYIVQL